MTYRKVNYRDVEPVSEAMHFLREPLESRQVGVTISRCDPGWESKPHDHADDGHEELYLLMEGTATVRVDDEEVAMEQGDAIWIAPASTRQIVNGDGESAFVLISAPGFEDPGRGDEQPWTFGSFPG